MAQPITPQMYAGRIAAHGKIASLATAFDLNGEPFSVFIIPADYEEVEPILLDCKLLHDNTATACPFNLKQWNEPMVKELSATAGCLSSYSLYWGAGITASE